MRRFLRFLDPRWPSCSSPPPPSSELGRCAHVAHGDLMCCSLKAVDAEPLSPVELTTTSVDLRTLRAPSLPCRPRWPTGQQNGHARSDRRGCSPRLTRHSRCSVARISAHKYRCPLATRTRRASGRRGHPGWFCFGRRALLFWGQRAARGLAPSEAWNPIQLHSRYSCDAAGAGARSSRRSRPVAPACLRWFRVLDVSGVRHPVAVEDCQWSARLPPRLSP